MADGAWPNLFVAGAMRAGTTNVYHALAAHPEVFMPPVKEPNFFADELCKAQYRDHAPTAAQSADGHRHHAIIDDADEYRQLYAASGDAKYRGDASPSYLPSETASRRIAARIPDAHVIILLRDPVERAHSHYQMDFAIGRTRLSFADAIGKEMHGTRVGSDHGYLQTGRYADQLQCWIRDFGERLHAMSTHTLIADRASALVEVARFLDISPFPDQTRDAPANLGVSPRWQALNHLLHTTGLKARVSASALPVSWKNAAKKLLYGQERPSIDEAVDAQLRDFYASDVEAVRELFGIDLYAQTASDPE